MTFKRYDGFVGSAPQSMIDNGLPICPFCGESPHWLLELESGMVSAMTCMCEKCSAKIYSENQMSMSLIINRHAHYYIFNIFLLRIFN